MTHRLDGPDMHVEEGKGAGTGVHFEQDAALIDAQLSIGQKVVAAVRRRRKGRYLQVWHEYDLKGRRPVFHLGAVFLESGHVSQPYHQGTRRGLHELGRDNLHRPRQWHFEVVTVIPRHDVEVRLPVQARHRQDVGARHPVSQQFQGQPRRDGRGGGIYWLRGREAKQACTCTREGAVM